MVDEIKVNEEELSSAIQAISTGEQAIDPSGSGSAPGRSSTSAAMDAFAQKAADLASLITNYKALLQNDVRALEQAKAEFEAADAAAAASMEG